MEAAALFRQAIAYHRAGALAQAERCYRAVLAASPELAEVWHLLGLLTVPEQAAACMAQAVRLRPGEAPFWGDLGACLYRLGRLAEAEAALRRALAFAPALEPALGCLGLVLAAGGAAGEAETCLRAALRLRPDVAATHTNLGNLLHDLGRFGEAEAELRTALALRPDAADPHHNLAVALAAAGRLAEAEACCRAALRLDPAHADARYTLGTTLLLQGRLSEGWPGFEWRWRRRGHRPPRAFAQPQWDGGALHGRTLLLHAEQGLGDAIQMLRFVPALAAGGPVVLEVPAPLLRLARSLAADIAVVARGEALPPFAVQCSLMTLPFVLGVTLATIPAAVPYLRPPAPSGRSAALPGLRVGLAWAGNPHYPADARRSVPPAALAPLGTLAGVSFVSLQKDPLARPDFALHDWTGEFSDLADTAAAIAGLDLVIAADSAVAHLAGALGKPVWLLNRFDTCWRWLRERADSPWYPSLRIFRQSAPGDWAGVIAAVRAALVARLAEAAG